MDPQTNISLNILVKLLEVERLCLPVDGEKGLIHIIIYPKVPRILISCNLFISVSVASATLYFIDNNKACIKSCAITQW